MTGELEVRRSERRRELRLVALMLVGWALLIVSVVFGIWSLRGWM